MADGGKLKLDFNLKDFRQISLIVQDADWDESGCIRPSNRGSKLAFLTEKPRDKD